MKESKKKADVMAEKNYPGAAINAADDNKVTDKLVRERVKTENNNPRNHD